MNPPKTWDLNDSKFKSELEKSEFFWDSFAYFSFGLNTLNIKIKRLLIAKSNYLNVYQIGNHLITNIQGNPHPLSVLFLLSRKNVKFWFKRIPNKGKRGNKTLNETNPTTTTTTTIHNDTHRRPPWWCTSSRNYSLNFLWRGENKNTHTRDRDREGGNNQLKNNTLIQQPVCMAASDKIKR